MKYPRIIPTILLTNQGAIKTKKFTKSIYLGDPINIIKIFNSKQVDEILILDIDKNYNKKKIDYDYIKNLSNECFMPAAYGGGIRNVEECEKIVGIGFEKVVLCSSIFENYKLIKEVVQSIGSSATIVSINYKYSLFGKCNVYSRGGQKRVSESLKDVVSRVIDEGAGEILLYNINNDGMFSGFDINTLKLFSSTTSVPIIVAGGCRGIEDVNQALKEGKASAVGIGSKFVFLDQDRSSIMINYFSEQELSSTYKLLNEK